MLMWQQSVTDRTQSDIKRVIALLEKGWNNFSYDEKEEWNEGLKGALNTSDLKRIQNNIQLLSDVLEIDLTVSAVPEPFNESFFKEIIENTEIIRNSYCTHTTTPVTPQVPLNVFQKWNDIEKILEDVYEILLNNFHYYCGSEIYSGDETGLLL